MTKRIIGAVCGLILLGGCSTGNPRVDVLLGIAKPAAVALLQIEVDELDEADRNELCDIVRRSRETVASIDEVLAEVETAVCEESETQ